MNGILVPDANKVYGIVNDKLVELGRYDDYQDLLRLREALGGKDFTLGARISESVLKDKEALLDEMAADDNMAMLCSQVVSRLNPLILASENPDREAKREARNIGSHFYMGICDKKGKVITTRTFEELVLADFHAEIAFCQDDTKLVDDKEATYFWKNAGAHDIEFDCDLDGKEAGLAVLNEVARCKLKSQLICFA